VSSSVFLFFFFLIKSQRGEVPEVHDAGLWAKRCKITFPLKGSGENRCHWGMSGGVTRGSLCEEAFLAECSTCKGGEV
jgi:hypothetical protein